MPIRDRLPRLADVALAGARRAASVAADAARELAEDVRRRRQAQPQREAGPPAPEPAPVNRPPRDAPDQPPADHVDREAVLVAESHDPDAARPVGAQITVDEPWDGYDDLSPEQVVAEVEQADAGTAAVVRLYERLHRADAGVLEAIDQRLATLGG
jgi:hypothetical protein